MFITIDDKSNITVQFTLQQWLKLALEEWLNSRYGGDTSKILQDLSLEYPRYKQFGDYSTNIALRLSKQLNTLPMQVAEAISTYLMKHPQKPQIIQKIEPAAPGFVNIHLNVLKTLKFEYDLQPSKETKTKIIVEHTSVNPNKALHIGHLRNAVLGDTIQRILRYFYNKVEVQNYIDDTGLQVADTVAALELFGERPKGDQAFDDYCWDIYSKYHKLLKEEPDKYSKQRHHIVHDIEHFGDYFTRAQALTQKILDHHLAELSNYGIRYDLLIYESHIIYFKLWDYAFELLKSKELIKYFKQGEWAGCWVFIGNNLNKILVRSNGTKVYTAKDIAYHLWKVGALKDFDFLYERWQGTLFKDPQLYRTSSAGKSMPGRFGNGDKVINIIDARQAYPQQVVKLAVETVLGKSDVIKHIPYGVVALSRSTASMLGIDTSDGRSVYHMSGRKGIGIKSKEFFKQIQIRVKEKINQNKQTLPNEYIKAIALGAMRYYLLKFTVDRDIVFDVEEAINITGKTGPYLQYSYVRALNILKKANLLEDSQKVPLSKTTIKNIIQYLINHQDVQPLKATDLNQYETELARLLVKQNDYLVKSAEVLEPAILADYAFELANAFNSMYEHTPVLRENSESRKNFRLYLVARFLKSMQTLLDLLGIPMLDKM